MDALNEDADPLDAVRASLARTAALTQETMEEAPPDPLQEAQRRAALKAMREREARVAQFFDFAPPATRVAAALDKPARAVLRGAANAAR